VSHARRTFASAVSAAATGEVLEDVRPVRRITRREQKTVARPPARWASRLHRRRGRTVFEVSVPGFVDERGLAASDRAAFAAALGVSPNALSRWADPDPDSALARDLRDTVKARYEPESWRRVAQPIFDRLRQRRRDALVAYLLHGLDLDRVEQLFELLLIDPGMEPVVRTSRLRTAISSVQLFVQRCLLNLEVDVDPTAIDAARWQWMRRYRVWEANRKIFLYPENWLEPEFRDQKSHLFTELEGAAAGHLRRPGRGGAGGICASSRSWPG
jgi:hypothetical protein